MLDELADKGFTEIESHNIDFLKNYSPSWG